MADFKKFHYVVTYYTRDEIDKNSPTRRQASTWETDTSSATRAVTAFKRTAEAKNAVILAVVPDNEQGRYDVGPVQARA